MRTPWNKGKIIGQKKAFKPDEVAMIEKMLSRSREPNSARDLAIFRTAIDSLLRSSDLLNLKIRNVRKNGEIVDQFSIRQMKTKTPHACYLEPKTKNAIENWIQVGWDFIPDPEDALFPITSRTYMRIVKGFAEMLHLDPDDYSTHSMRRTKARQIYKETKNLEIVRQALGQKSLGATSAYLGIEREDAEISIRAVKI